MKPLIGLTMNAVDADEVRRPSTFGSHYVNYAYVDAVRRAGGVPVALPFGQDDEADAVLAMIHGLLVTGGKDCDPAAYGARRHPTTHPVIAAKTRYELRLLDAADRLDLPVFGICLGCQLVNVARGGTLVQHLPDERPGALVHPAPEEHRRRPSHDVEVTDGTRLAAICGAGRLPVNSLHHQGIDHLGQDLVVCARADDGLVEAIEDPERSFLLGVQWHPEDLPTLPRHAALFEAFVEASRAR